MASKELEAALAAARAASEVIRAYYLKSPAVRLKADASPVTEADERAEEAIRATLSERFPSYGFYGEETGQHAMGAGQMVQVDQPQVGAIGERVPQRRQPGMGDPAVVQHRTRGQRARAGRHQVRPRARAAWTPDRQPSSWKPQPW